LDNLISERGAGANLSTSEQQLLEQYLPTDLGTIAYLTLPTIYPQTLAEGHSLGIDISPQSLWRLYLPIALHLVKQTTPFVLGTFGMQGTGKTTLTKILQTMLQAFGKTSVILSLDDLYLTHHDRLALQKNDPRLRWRGAPSTHNISLGIELLQHFKMQKYPLTIPRFDKSLWGGSGDQIAPEIIVNRVDILLFEGWFVGLKPLPDSAFLEISIPERSFALDCNQRLANYQELWQFIDYLVALIPQDYRVSLAWRSQAEQKQQQQGKGAMGTAEIREFVHYFWQALPPQLFLPAIANYANWVVHLDNDRQITGITYPYPKPIPPTAQSFGLPVPENQRSLRVDPNLHPTAEIERNQTDR
jgi:D-glycerate 3-kinase